MKDFEAFKTKVNRSLNNMEAKIAFLNDGVKGLSEGFKDFKDDITDFMSFTEETYSDHDKRIRNPETKFPDGNIFL